MDFNEPDFEDFGMVLCPDSNRTGNETSGEDFQIKMLNRIAYKIIAPTIVAIGLVGNLLNLIVLTRPSLKGVTYTYLIGLACSDLGVLICSFTMMMRMTNEHEGTYGSYPYTLYYGHLELPMANTFQASSIFIVICLTVDRFISVCVPREFKRFHTHSIARSAILCCYIIALAVSFPLGFLKTICRSADDPTKFDFTENSNLTDTTTFTAYLIAEGVIVRFGPAKLLAILNTMIIIRFRAISKKRREMRGLGKANGNGNGNANGDGNGAGSEQLLLRGEKISKKIWKEEKRLLILLTNIVVLFFVTIMPVAVLNICYTEKLGSNFAFQIFRAVANNLELCNFSLNFYIYFLCCKEFRRNFLAFFLKCCPKMAEVKGLANSRAMSHVLGDGNNGGHSVATAISIQGQKITNCV